jgi:hypothetical protein
VRQERALAVTGNRPRAKARGGREEDRQSLERVRVEALVLQCRREGG